MQLQSSRSEEFKTFTQMQLVSWRKIMFLRSYSLRAERIFFLLSYSRRAGRNYIFTQLHVQSVEVFSFRESVPGFS